jgi:hypothetical protein
MLYFFLVLDYAAGGGRNKKLLKLVRYPARFMRVQVKQAALAADNCRDMSYK